MQILDSGVKFWKPGHVESVSMYSFPKKTCRSLWILKTINGLVIFPQDRSTKCLFMNFGCKLQLIIKWKLTLWWMNGQACWIPNMVIQRGEPLSHIGSMAHNLLYSVIFQTRVLLSKRQCNFWIWGSIFKTLAWFHMDSVSIYSFTNQICEILWISVIKDVV